MIRHDTEMVNFNYNNWNFAEAIDALKAFDSGAFDSGVSDAGLRIALVQFFRSLPSETRRAMLARYARRLLTEEAIESGYGLDDIRCLIEWLLENGIVP